MSSLEDICLADCKKMFLELSDDKGMVDTIFCVGNEGCTKNFPVLGALFGVQSDVFKAMIFGKMAFFFIRSPSIVLSGI